MTTELTVASIGAVAVIIAALIGLIVAVSSAVIAKEQKVSEFRQAWINDLRNDCAQFFTITFNIIDLETEIQHYQKGNFGAEGFIELSEKKSVLFLEQFRLFNLISLRLNPVKDRFYIEKLRTSLYNANDDADFDAKIDCFNEVRVDTHRLLKEEWEIVKKGEKKFVKFRSFGELCLFAFITAFFVALAFIKIPELSHYLVDLCVIKKGT